MNNHDSYAALLQAIARVIPDAGGKAEDLATALENHHQQYQKCYEALHDLAAKIDVAAQAMSSEDHQIGSNFQ